MLSTSLTALVIIFMANLLVGMYYGFGIRHYWFFEILHFLAGFFVAMFLYSFTRSSILILVLLGIITVLWESLEIIIAKIPSLANYVKGKLGQKNITPGLGDTILDIVLNFFGAFVFIYLSRTIDITAIFR